MRYVVYGAVAAALTVLIPGLASAAPAPAYQWSGFYGGGQVGYGMVADNDTLESNPGSPLDTIGAESTVGGIFAGFNQFLMGNWLGGLEVEGNWSDFRGGYANTGYGGDRFIAQSSYAARVRLGVLTAPSTLFYGSVGVGTGNFDYTHGYFQTCGCFNLNQTFVGVQLGAGLETFVTPNLSVRAEGVFTHYGDAFLYTYGNPGVPVWGLQPDVLTVRVGLAYHTGWLGQSQATTNAAPVVRSWTGFYVGGHVGAALSRTIDDYDPSFTTPNDPYLNFASSSGAGGGDAGINWQFGKMVAGVEADGTLVDQLERGNDHDYGRQSWSAAVRARLGVVTPGNTLLYGTVGWAASAFDYSGFYPPISNYGGSVFSANGLELGAGAEAFVTSRLSLRIDGLYTNYGDHPILSFNTPYKIESPRTLEGRIGLSYHLN